MEVHARGFEQARPATRFTRAASSSSGGLKYVSELMKWSTKQLRPYGIRPRTIWIGEDQAKGYYREDFSEAFQRYVPKAEAQAYLAELTKPEEPEKGAPAPATTEPPTPTPVNS